MPGEILFLFNHDAPHQVAHIAGIAKVLAESVGAATITCACASDGIRERVRAILGEDASARVGWLDVALPAWQEQALAPLDRVAPVRRVRRLDHHAERLNAASVLVSSERTCLRIRRAGGATRFVYIPHGAGDRAVAYHPEKGGFDLILASGDKGARELVARGVAPAERVRVVGYPKFDTVDLSRRPKLFDNDRPVLLYNPHFDPLLSSWYDEGPALLDWFASPRGAEFNLIFAPHIMLFRKRIHVSLEYRTARLRPGIRETWRAAPNILVDTGSTRLVDMTYTLAADAYIGDVSSQIYEFLVRPRPVFFIDRFSHNPRSREGSYPAWRAGDTVRTAQDLTGLLPGHLELSPEHRAVQEAIFADTMSYIPGCTASQRAAEAIAGLLDG